MFALFRGKRIGKKGRSIPLPQCCAWEKVDKNWLTSGLSLSYVNEVIHGPTAEFYPDQQLRRLSIYCSGRMSLVHHRLELAHGVAKARVVGEGVLCTFELGIEEVYLCFQDEVEFTSEVAGWQDWVRKWIAQISAGQRVTLLNRQEDEEQEALF